MLTPMATTRITARAITIAHAVLLIGCYSCEWDALPLRVVAGSRRGRDLVGLVPVRRWLRGQAQYLLWFLELRFGDFSLRKTSPQDCQQLAGLVLGARL